MTRVVVTGYGTISALGQDADSYAQNLLAGVSGIGPIRAFDSSLLRTHIAAEVPDYDPSAHFSQREQSQIDRFSQFAILASREAAAQAGLTIDEKLAERTCVVYGTGIGGQTTQDQNYNRLYAEGKYSTHPFTVAKLMPSAAASHISMDLGITGPAFGIVSACSSAAHAIANGWMLIRSGLADVALVGGSEALICLGAVAVWESMRVLALDTCRPFSAKRGGLVLGEGAGTLVLESLEHARSRGAPILAELAGVGMTSDAGNLIRPSLHGPVRAMQQAITGSGLQATDVAYINAHGTGTLQNDPVETQAIHAVFGEHAARLVVSSTKSMIGHTLGAAGALEAIATVVALQRQTAPPTMNYLAADPKCDLDYAPNASRPLEIGVALSNSFAFGGLNVALCFRHGDLIEGG